MTLLHIDSERITGDVTPHSATALDPEQPYGQWRVTWCPDLRLERHTAITAMVLAELHARGDLKPQIGATWSAELGMTLGKAIALIEIPKGGAA